MKSWALLCLLVLTFYGHRLVYAQWYAFTSMLGLVVAVLLWVHRGKRGSMIWMVSLFGVVEGLQIFGCQAWNARLRLQTSRTEGTCDLLTGFPFTSLGLLAALLLCAAWLDRNR